MVLRNDACHGDRRWNRPGRSIQTRRTWTTGRWAPASADARAQPSTLLPSPPAVIPRSESDKGSRLLPGPAQQDGGRSHGLQPVDLSARSRPPSGAALARLPPSAHHHEHWICHPERCALGPQAERGICVCLLLPVVGDGRSPLRPLLTPANGCWNDPR